MKLTRAEILLLVVILFVNYNLYFLNEELLIYSSAVVFLAIVYIFIKRFIATYLFVRMYKFYCNFLLYHLREQLCHFEAKLALYESRYNLQVQKEIINTYNLILKNRIKFFSKLVKILAALAYAYDIKASVANRKLNYKDVFKNPKFRGHKPW